MSLDVTPGMPSSPGTGSPPSPLAGAATAGPPGAALNALFAALLAGQVQTTSATVPAKAATATPPSSLGSSSTTPDEEPKPDREKKEADPNDPTLATSWLPMPVPLPMQTPQATLIETAPSASDLPVVRNAVSTQEVMDTVPASNSPAPAGNADLPKSELLPFSSVLPAPPNTAAGHETRAVTSNAIQLPATPGAVSLPATTLPANAVSLAATTNMVLQAASTSLANVPNAVFTAPVAYTAGLPLTASGGNFPANGNALPSAAPVGMPWVSTTALPHAFTLASASPVPAAIVTGLLSVARPALTFDSPVVLTSQVSVAPIPVTSAVTGAVSAGVPALASPQPTDATSQVQTTSATVPAKLSLGMSFLTPEQASVALVSDGTSAAPTVVVTTPAAVPSAGASHSYLPTEPADKSLSQVPVQMPLPQTSVGVPAWQTVPQMADSQPAPLSAFNPQDQSNASFSPTLTSLGLGDVSQGLQTAQALKTMPTPLDAPAMKTPSAKSLPQTAPAAQALPAVQTSPAPQVVATVPTTVLPQAALMPETVPVPQTLPVLSPLSSTATQTQSKPALQAAPALAQTSETQAAQLQTIPVLPGLPVSQTAPLQMDFTSRVQAVVPPVSSQTTLENPPQTANNTSSSVMSASTTLPLNQTVLKHPQVLSSGTNTQAATLKETQSAPPLIASRAATDTEKSADESTKTNTDTSDGSIELPGSQWAAGLAPVVDKNVSTTGNVAPSGPVTHEDRVKVMSQVTDAVSTLQQRTAPGSASQMTLQLHPKEWGEVHVSVRMTPTRDADGVPTTAIVAHVVASSPVVKTALEAHSSELHRTLQDAGLRLDRLTVTVQSVDSSGQSQTAAGDGQPSFSGSRNDQWQTPQAQTNGNTTSGGNSSTFSAFSEGRNGRSYTGQQPSAAYGTQSDAESELFPATIRPTRSSAGFDQRV